MMNSVDDELIKLALEKGRQEAGARPPSRDELIAKGRRHLEDSICRHALDVQRRLKSSKGQLAKEAVSYIATLLDVTWQPVKIAEHLFNLGVDGFCTEYKRRSDTV